VRYPTSKTKDVKSQPAAMQKELESKYHVLRDKTYILLTQATDYGAFSNDSHIGPEQDPISYNNIESIHNDIHGFAGEDGHMGTVDYAAFDPIFWLHHANVRYFCLSAH
jgi:tyrosinase